jgi:hypothetical protein
MRKLVAALFAMTLCFMGCQTTPHKPRPTRAEAISALTTMTQGLTNKPFTEADLKNLTFQVLSDPQAQSALRSINTALRAQHTVKYCPVDGQRFSADMIYCPIHHVKLKYVEEDGSNIR